MVGHRYYNPEWGRWLSPDDIEYLDPQSINGLNLYAYCNNDPINMYDPDGHMAISTIILLTCIGVGALVGGTYAGVTAYNDGARGLELIGWTTLGAIVGGAIGGFIGYYAGPMAASFFGSGSGFAFAGGLGSAGVAISGTMAGTLVTAGAIGLTCAGALAGSSLMMMSRPNSGRIRFSDGTGIDPDTQRPVTSKERAYEIYRSLKDPAEKEKWRQWMKGKGWRTSHLK